jgi:ketol-acid reductoisomerase
MRATLDWRHRFREATQPVVEDLSASVASDHDADVVIRASSDPGYRQRVNEELDAVRQSEMGALANRCGPSSHPKYAVC